MDEKKEITMRDDLLELLALTSEKIRNTDAETETDSKKRSKYSQYIDGYDKLYKLLLADDGQAFDQYIQDSELERKKCEYLEDVARKTKELELRAKELELKEKELQELSKNRERENNLKEREIDIHEATAKDNGRWWNRPIVQTGLACFTIGVVNISGMIINTTEFPIKNIIEKWMQKPNIKLQ